MFFLYFIFFILYTYFDILFFLSMLYCYLCSKEKEDSIWIKYGTVTVSVFRSDDNITSFEVETDDDKVLPVSYVIEDTLKLY